MFSNENKHSGRIAEAIMSPTDPNKFKRGINPKKNPKKLSVFIPEQLAQDQYPAKFLGFWLVTILFNNRISTSKGGPFSVDSVTKFLKMRENGL